MVRVTIQGDHYFSCVSPWRDPYGAIYLPPQRLCVFFLPQYFKEDRSKRKKSRTRLEGKTSTSTYWSYLLTTTIEIVIDIFLLIRLYEFKMFQRYVGGCYF